MLINDAGNIKVPIDLLRKPESAELFDLERMDFRILSAGQLSNPIRSETIRILMFQIRSKLVHLPFIFGF